MKINLKHLRALGFDLSSAVPFKREFNVKCSQCDALAINGIPTHERGCPHAKHECAGCNNLIPVTRRYCEDCL